MCRAEGLPRFGSTDFGRKAVGKLQGSRFPAAATRHGAGERATCTMNQSLHLIQHFPSRGSQWGTRITAAFRIQEHTVTHREQKMLQLSQLLPSPHLTPAVGWFSYSEIVALAFSREMGVSYTPMTLRSRTYAKCPFLSRRSWTESSGLRSTHNLAGGFFHTSSVWSFSPTLLTPTKYKPLSKKKTPDPDFRITNR